jgi:hypothetical protein
MKRQKIVLMHKYAYYVIILQVITLNIMAYMCPFPFMLGFACPKGHMVQP